MKKRFLNCLILTFLAVIMFWSVSFANILSVLPPENNAHDPCTRVSARFADASKLIGDLYPSKFFEAIEPIASSFELEEIVQIANVAKALSESNLREVAVQIVLGEDNELHDGGVIMSVPGGKRILDDAVKSGKLTLFDLLSSLGEPVIEAMNAFGIPFSEYVFERDSDGVFSNSDYYVCIVGDKIVMFNSKEGTLSVAKAVRDAPQGVPFTTKHQTVFLVHASKEIAKTPEDINIEIGISYEDSTWKMKAVTNAFKLMPGRLRIPLEGKELERVQKVIETVPMVGKGSPFLISGGNTFIDGLDSIEEQLMTAGDMSLTLNWAILLHMVQQYGISKKDLGDLLAGSAAIVLGLDSKLFEIPLSLGGYFAVTGRDGAAARVISSVSDALAISGEVAAESKIDGWDKVFSVTLDPSMTGFLIAQRGETLLAGIMNPDDLKFELTAEEVGTPEEKMLNWMFLSAERIWTSARSAYVPLSAMAMSGWFGEITDEQKKIIQFTGQLLKTDFPINAFKLWMPAPDELEYHIIMNPSPGVDFWKVFFEWFIRILNTVD